MRKNKKLLSLALSACMVGSMLAGCSEQSSDDSDATSSAATTEAESSEKDAESSAEEDVSESSAEEETENAENYDAEGTAAGEFIEKMSATKDMTSYKVTSEIVINGESAYDDGETNETYGTDITLGLVELVDGNGNMSLTISADYEDPDNVDAIAIHGDLLTLSKVDDRVYLDISPMYDVVLEAAGLLSGEEDVSEDDLETYAETFGTSLDEIKSLLVLGIPIGDLDLSQTDYSALEDVMERVGDDLTAAIDSLGEDFMTVDGDTYTFTLDKDNAVDVVDAILGALDGNLEDIYDAYIETLKASDYSEYMDSLMNAIVDEIIEGLEEVADEDIDEETLKEIENEINEGIDLYEESFDEIIAELEDDKQDFLDEFADILEEIDGGMEATDELSEDYDTSAVATVTFSGGEGSRVIDSEMTFGMYLSYVEEYDEDELYDGSEAYTYSMSEAFNISIKSTIEEGDVTISAPESYATLADLTKVIYNVYTIYSEYAVDDYDATTDYEYDDGYDYSYLYNDYTQAELCEIYGVTLADDQVIACDEVDNDGVIITAYDGMEFFSPDDTCSMMMEVSDDYSVYVTIFIYDTDFDAEFYEEYYNAEMVEDNICYYEPYDGSAYLVYFGDNITIEIDLDTSDDDALEEMTDGNNVDFLKGLLDLCEIVSPA